MVDLYPLGLLLLLLVFNLKDDVTWVILTFPFKNYECCTIIVIIPCDVLYIRFFMVSWLKCGTPMLDSLNGELPGPLNLSATVCCRPEKQTFWSVPFHVEKKICVLDTLKLIATWGKKKKWLTFTKLL